MGEPEGGSVPIEACGIAVITDRAGHIEQDRTHVGLGAITSSKVPGRERSDDCVAMPTGSPVDLAAGAPPHDLACLGPGRFADSRQSVLGPAQARHMGEDEGTDDVEHRIGSRRPLVESRRLTEEAKGTAEVSCQCHDRHHVAEEDRTQVLVSQPGMENFQTFQQRQCFAVAAFRHEDIGEFAAQNRSAHRRIRLILGAGSEITSRIDDGEVGPYLLFTIANERSLSMEQVRTRMESQFPKRPVHFDECSWQFRVLPGLLQGRESEDVSVFVLRVFVRQASEQPECRAPVAELQMELGTPLPKSGVQIAKLGLPVRRAGQIDVGKRLAAPFGSSRFEAAQRFEIMVGHILGKGGPGTVLEAPCVDGMLVQIESVAVRRTEQNAVSQLFAQTVDLDVQASGDTVGPLVRPECFDDERCRRPGSEPENQQRQKGSLRASLYPVGHTMMENLHAPHYAQFHPAIVESREIWWNTSTNLTNIPAACGACWSVSRDRIESVSSRRTEWRRARRSDRRC